jgi:hypothetical protein
MTKLDFLIQSISDLDIDSIDLLLDDHRTYQDLPKYQFISRLQNILQQFTASGNKELIPYAGSCGSCVKGCKGYAFISPHSLQHIDLIIQYDGENITDVFCCALLKLDHEMKLGERVYIKPDLKLSDFDPDNPPF